MKIKINEVMKDFKGRVITENAELPTRCTKCGHVEAGAQVPLTIGNFIYNACTITLSNSKMSREQTLATGRIAQRIVNADDEIELTLEEAVQIKNKIFDIYKSPILNVRAEEIFGA